MPGSDPGGLIVTTVVGMVGALVGGFVGTLMGIGTVSGFNLSSIGIAILGSLILLAGFRMVRRTS
jgi:uncharacterized membrane protein YeaQ/YmgE (transglycosylase-associated protein family)